MHETGPGVTSRPADALHYWKTHRYKDNHIPFVEAVASLSTRRPLIELKRSSLRPMEWLVCRAGTTSPAVMTYAAIFSESEPYETGNLVWGDNPTPAGVSDSRRTSFAGFKASYSYTIDTYDDREIWALQEKLDRHVAAVKGFNQKNIPRTEWQNGQVGQKKFTFQIPMFFPHQSRGPPPQPPEGLHPWVKAAHLKSSSYRANPNRPRVRALDGGEFRPIGECVPNELEYGDLVGLVFTLAYVEGPRSWGPVYMVTDIIRLRRANRETHPLPTVEEDDFEVEDGNFSTAGLPSDPLLSDYVISTATRPAENFLAPPPYVASTPAPDMNGPPVNQTVLSSLNVGALAVPSVQTVPTNLVDDATTMPRREKRNSSESEVDGDDSASSTTETTQGSPGGPASEDVHQEGQVDPDSARKVRPRLEDAVYLEDIRVDSDPGPPARHRRGGAGKGRR